MTRSLMGHRAIRILGLMAVAPLLIGHGLGCLPWDDCPMTHDYVISGTGLRDSSINIGHNLNLSAGSLNYNTTNPVNVPIAVAPINYTISFPESDDSRFHLIHATINDAVPGGSSIGEMWVHSTIRRSKLLHPAARASFLSASFPIDEQVLQSHNDSTNAATSSYTLSGGHTGAEVLEMGAPLEVYVNNQLIFQRNVTDSTIRTPISFQAVPGNELRILAGGAHPSESLSQVWLHTPSGSGIKLFHNALNRRSDSTGVFLDAVYVLP